MMRLNQALMLLLVLGPLSVHAQGGSLELSTLVEKVHEVTDGAGNTRTELRPVETAVPGDQVIYTVTFTNIGGEMADNVRITNAIPQEMRYVEGSAFGPGTDVLYSADGGEHYGFAGELVVRNEDGTQRAATPEDYTHIRWILGNPLDAGARGFARFRAVLR